MDESEIMKYSVVIPVFNSAQTIPEVTSRTLDFFLKQKKDFEVILVNDGSRDESWEVIKKLSRAHPQVTAINLARNYGQHTANLCGFQHASGDYIVTLDDDLQNPPEEIDKLIQTAANGHDLVMGNFEKKEHHLIRKIGSKVIGYLNEKIFHKSPQIVMSNFRIIHRSVIDRVKQFKGIDPYIPGLLVGYASNPANVPVVHQARQAGKSNYGLKKIMKLTASLLFNYSIYPLRFLVILGAVVAFLSFLWGISLIIRSFFFGTEVPGWTSLTTLLSFFSGYIILLLGALGEYVIRIVRNVSESTPYLIKNISQHDE